jgi:hypothetical protein
VVAAVGEVATVGALARERARVGLRRGVAAQLGAAVEHRDTGRGDGVGPVVGEDPPPPAVDVGDRRRPRVVELRAERQRGVDVRDAAILAALESAVRALLVGEHELRVRRQVARDERVVRPDGPLDRGPLLGAATNTSLRLPTRTR